MSSRIRSLIISSKTRFRYSPLLHIGSLDFLHPNPVGNSYRSLTIIRHFSQNHLHSRIFCSFIGKHINIHRRYTKMGIMITFTQHRNIKFIVILLDIHPGVKGIFSCPYILRSQSLNRNIIFILMITFYLKIISVIRSQIKCIAYLISCSVIGSIKTMQFYCRSIFISEIRLITLFLIILNTIGIKPFFSCQRRICPFLSLIYFPFCILHILIHIESKSNLSVLIKNRTLHRCRYALCPTIFPIDSCFGIYCGSRKRYFRRKIFCRPFYKSKSR